MAWDSMIEVPREAYKQTFERGIERGCVIRTLYQFDEEDPIYKYFVAISKDPQNDPLLFVITTSNPCFFNKHPQYEQDIIRIPKGVFDFFPCETILDCKRIFKHAKDNLRTRLEAKELVFCGHLTETYLSKIDETIKNSRHISLQDKRLILGDDL